MQGRFCVNRINLLFSLKESWDKNRFYTFNTDTIQSVLNISGMPLSKLRSVEPTDSEPVAVEGLLYLVTYEPQIHTKGALPFFLLCSEAAESRVCNGGQTVPSLALSCVSYVAELCRGAGKGCILKELMSAYPAGRGRRVSRGDQGQLQTRPSWQCSGNRAKVKSEIACWTCKTGFSTYRSMQSTARVTCIDIPGDHWALRDGGFPFEVHCGA